MGCYWNNKQSSDYADKRDNTRYIIFPDDIQAENGELGFCEGIFQAIETALDILDALDLAFLAFNIAKKIKEFIRLLRLLLQEYRNDPNKYRKVLKDLIIQLKELIQELEIEKVKGVISDVLIDQIIAILENLIKLLEQATGIGCTVLNFAFLHPIDNQKYDTLCRLIDGRDGIERWLVNNITSIFGLIKFKPTDPTYDRIILSRKRILTRIFDEVCTCISFGSPPPFTPTPTPTNTCIPCRVTQIPVYDIECIDTLDGEITPTIYQLNQNGLEIPVSVIDMINCTENPAILDLLTCTLTTCTPSPSTSTNSPSPSNPYDCPNDGLYMCCKHPDDPGYRSEMQHITDDVFDWFSLPDETHDETLARYVHFMNTNPNFVQLPSPSDPGYFIISTFIMPDYISPWSEWRYGLTVACNRPFEGYPGIGISEPIGQFCCGNRRRITHTNYIVKVAHPQGDYNIISQFPADYQGVSDQSIGYARYVRSEIFERVNLCERTGCPSSSSPPISTISLPPITSTFVPSTTFFSSNTNSVSSSPSNSSSSVSNTSSSPTPGMLDCYLLDAIIENNGDITMVNNHDFPVMFEIFINDEVIAMGTISGNSTITIPNNNTGDYFIRFFNNSSNICSYAGTI